jgi:hypothetical protein
MFQLSREPNRNHRIKPEIVFHSPNRQGPSTREVGPASGGAHMQKKQFRDSTHSEELGLAALLAAEVSGEGSSWVCSNITERERERNVGSRERLS